MKLITYLTTFIIIILAELGDKTQFATLIFASNNPKRKWQVLLAAALALSLCVTIEVTIGLTLAKYISPSLINKATGIIFLCVGLFVAFSVVKGYLKPKIQTPTVQSINNEIINASQILKS